MSETSEKNEQDELLPFRRAAELGCPDFKLTPSGLNVWFSMGGFTGYPLPVNDDARINRYAAAVCAEFWMAQYRTLAPLASSLALKKYLRLWDILHRHQCEYAHFAGLARAFGQKYGQEAKRD